MNSDTQEPKDFGPPPFEDPRVHCLTAAFDSKGEQIEFIRAVDDFYVRGIEPKLTGTVAYAFKLARPILEEQQRTLGLFPMVNELKAFAERITKNSLSVERPKRAVDEASMKRKLDTTLLPCSNPSISLFYAPHEERGAWFEDANDLLSRIKHAGIRSEAISMYGSDPKSRNFTLYYQAKTREEEIIMQDKLGEVLSQELRRDTLRVESHGTDENRRLWFRIKPIGPI